MERSATVLFRQHPELTLSLAVAERYKDKHHLKVDIDVGGSHALCCYCREYLDLLIERCPHRFTTRASRGEQPNGWLMPPGGPKEVEGKMVPLVVRRVDEVVVKIQKRQAADREEREAVKAEQAGNP
jgi:hypothetical protein